MPPKRKMAPQPAEESPSKRVARSAPTVIGRLTRSTSHATPVPETPTKPKIIRTYGKKPSATSPVKSLREEDGKDELDLLSPDPIKVETPRTTKKATKKVVTPLHSTENLATPRTTKRTRDLADDSVQKERAQPNSKSPSKRSGKLQQESEGESDRAPPTPTPNKVRRTYSIRTPTKTPLTQGTYTRTRKVPELEPESDHESEADIPSLPPSPTKPRTTRKSSTSRTSAASGRRALRLVPPLLEPEPPSASESECDALSPPPSPSKSKSRKEVAADILASSAKAVLSAVPPRLRQDVPETGSPLSTPRKSKAVSPFILPQETPTHDRYMELPSSPASRPASPTKQKQYASKTLPAHLLPCLNAQKRVIIRKLREPATFSEPAEGQEGTANEIAFQQLSKLLEATISRGESNSCLVIGPRGSGKSSTVGQCLSKPFKHKPVVIRLNGHTQPSDRLAMREIAVQLREQIGPSLKSFGEVFTTLGEEIEDGAEDGDVDMSQASAMALPPPSHLPALISVLPNLPRPVVVILDAFDLFALHPRQSLLYCLFDTVQSCHTTKNTKGLLIVGLTTRIDTITILEKRVKSRFSGRMLRCAPPLKLDTWEGCIKDALCFPIDKKDCRDIDNEVIDEWTTHWQQATEEFMKDAAVQNILQQSHAVGQDIRLLSRLLLFMVVNLSADNPVPSCPGLERATLAQRTRPQFPRLHALPYPHLCLLIASVHVDTAGHSMFNFEMLHTHFRDQLRASTSAPVQLNGGSIGMMKCSRKVLLAAFENLIESRLFISTTSYTSNIGKEFVKYRSAVGRLEVKKAIEQTGQVNLKKWLTKAT